MTQSTTRHVWTVAEAKAHLSEVLRRAEQEGPQRIGVRKSFVVVPAELWHASTQAVKPLGRWLVDHMPRGANLDAPNRHEPGREIPFSGGETASCR
jgi:prevent-host-death family protein